MSEEIVKVAVLEQKFADFSNIVNKLDDAIQKLSEVNTNVIKMLAVHDEKIDQHQKSEDFLLKMLDDVRLENTEDHKRANERIAILEKEIGEVSKIKWMTIGCGVILAVLTSAVSTLASGWWTPGGMQDARNMHNQLK
jgi:SpoU rRNA methylase family enzyme